jgi:lysophospholipase L1-like esterase
LWVSVTLTLAVLGDSIAYGQGATRTSDTVGSRLAAHLTNNGITTKAAVLAIPGARSDSLPGQVAQAKTLRPELALIIIGANDLTHFVPPQLAARHLGDAVGALTAAGAKVVVAPAPDLSVIPWLPAQVRAAVRSASGVLQQAQARAALAAGARVVTIGAAVTARFAGEANLFSADRFHPSSAGYAFITELVTPAIQAAAAEASQSVR